MRVSQYDSCLPSTVPIVSGFGALVQWFSENEPMSSCLRGGSGVLEGYMFVWTGAGKGSISEPAVTYWDTASQSLYQQPQAAESPRHPGRQTDQLPSGSAFAVACLCSSFPHQPLLSLQKFIEISGLLSPFLFFSVNTFFLLFLTFIYSTEVWQVCHF